MKKRQPTGLRGFIRKHRYLLLGISLGLLIAVTMHAYEEGHLPSYHLFLAGELKDTARCKELKQSLERVVSFSELNGAIKMRDVIIASKLASPERIGEIYRTRRRAIQAAQYEEFKGFAYWLKYWKWKSRKVATLQAFGC